MIKWLSNLSGAALISFIWVIAEFFYIDGYNYQHALILFPVKTLIIFVLSCMIDALLNVLYKVVLWFIERKTK